MEALTPKLRAKLIRFHGAYGAAHARLIGRGSSGDVAATEAWEEALRVSPLTAQEVRVYNMHLAIHLANDGELFPLPDDE